MAKRSRRERRSETDKPKTFSSLYTPAEPVEAGEVPAPFIPRVAEPAMVNSRKAASINFAQEYFYVYSEFKTILIITVLMFVVMVGLSFVI